MAVIRANGGFLIPLPFGDATQWSRNVIAAGGANLRWRGREYLTAKPSIVDWPTARPAFSRILRAVVPLLGIRQFVRLQDAGSAM